jgi:hypothetical protein
MGSLVLKKGGIEIWETPKKNTKDGWIGIFNRTEDIKSISLKPGNMGLDAAVSFKLQDVWGSQSVGKYKNGDELSFIIATNGAVFFKYIVAQ